MALRFEDALGVWPLLLEFFYTGRLEMSEGNAMGLLTAAKQLLVGEVETAARWVLRTCVRRPALLRPAGLHASLLRRPCLHSWLHSCCAALRHASTP